MTKNLTALLLLLALLLPVGMVMQGKAGPTPVVCTILDDSGKACCVPAATKCCCDATPAPSLPPASPLPQPASSSAAKAIAAALPNLLFLAELRRLSDSPDKPAPFSDRAPYATAPPVRLCVLRCSLLI